MIIDKSRLGWQGGKSGRLDSHRIIVMKSSTLESAARTNFDLNVDVKEAPRREIGSAGVGVNFTGAVRLLLGRPNSHRDRRTTAVRGHVEGADLRMDLRRAFGRFGEAARAVEIPI